MGAALTSTHLLIWIAGVVVFVCGLLLLRFGVTNRKLLLSEILIVAMLAFMFANIFTDQFTSTVFTQGIILLGFLVSGVLFVRITLRGEQDQEELTSLTDRLDTLNMNLETIVRERTEEIDLERIHTNTVIEHINQGIIECDESHTIVRVNSTAELILNTSREKIIGRSAMKESSADQLIANLQAILYPPDSETTTYTATLTAPTPKELQVVLLRASDTVPTNIYVLRDVTRANLISKSKSEFISVVAHQLRTPLTALKWSIETLRSPKTGSLDSKQLLRLDQIEKTSTNLYSLVEDLLMVSRIEAGHDEYTYENINLVTLLRASITRVAELAKTKNITFSKDLPRHKIAISADAHKLGQVFVSLLDNAVRYAHPESSISLALQEKEGEVTMHLCNDGILLPPAEVDQLFTKFYRSEAAIKKHTEGSGLSLFIAKRVLEQHQGEIHATPTPTGLCIETTLPKTT